MPILNPPPTSDETTTTSVEPNGSQSQSAVTSASGTPSQSEAPSADVSPSPAGQNRSLPFSSPLTPTTAKRNMKAFDSAMLRAHFQGDDSSLDLPLMDPPLKVFNQPRGGVVYFVVPTVAFVRELGPNIGMNVAEFEFPAYCNFFFYRRRVTLIVASTEIEKRIRKVFQETLFGPENVDVSKDFVEGTDKDQMPDMQRELNFFRVFPPGSGKLMQLEDLLEFIVFDEDGVAEISKTGEDGTDDVVQLQWRIPLGQNDGEYVIIQDGMNCGTVPDGVTLPEVSLNVPKAIHEKVVFEPPLFGVTVLGSSHGFDPSGRTSGYVLWLNKRGYMIDPPPQSTAILLANNIPPSLITGVIVTHCHADHDAGTFQKILQEGRITLMTTQTIHDSFLRKYAALSGLDPKLLQKSFQFRPVKIGENIKMRGGVFKFFYSLHAIPCVGFEVFLGDKSMVFSADHMNDPEKIKVLHADGVLNDWRKDQLLSFPWHRDIILHEAGIPPIHTPMEFLASLDEEVKSRLYIVHVGSNSFKPEYGLKPAPVGVENTLTLQVEKSENAAALEVLDLVTGIDLFSSLTIEHAREILQTVEVVKFKAGDYVIKKGDEGHSMMIIASGKAEVRVSMLKREDRINEERMNDKKGNYSPRLGAGISKASSFHSVGRASSALSQLSIAEAVNSDSEEEEEAAALDAAKAARDLERMDEKGSGRSTLNGVQEEIEKAEHVQTTVKTFTTGDYFGEQALVAPDCIRSADIIAVTDMTCYQFQRQDFNWLLHGTNVVAKIERMIMARQDAVWDLIGMNSVLRLLTPTQKTQLEQRCMPKYYEEGEYVWEEGGPATVACLIDSGLFKFVTAKSKGGRRRAPSVFRHLGPPPPPQFLPGCFVGEVDAFLEDKPLQTTLCAKEAGQVMLISKDDLLEFFTNAPGVLLAMLHTQFVLEEGGGGKEMKKPPKTMKDLKRRDKEEDVTED
ncbi:hypothetical protein TrRE_jg9818 [Triparma retinervis]|uniref:Cyclic nucleotide-binding domain-containing protein n=1 Tax=Triparma retinervis TaxID=2557542 RepID=A0A9W7KRK9_9STRA|nr:hypothetical protein TrRE_jg9818 [Triparma retinervis]